MSCEEMTDRITDRLKGRLEAKAERELEQHLADCAACREEATAIEALWYRLDEVEPDIPTERMRTRLDAALDAWQAESRPGWLEKLREILGRLGVGAPTLQLASALAMLMVGIWLGTRLGGTPAEEIRALRTEVQAMNQRVSMSLLGHPSASERLRGVEWSERTTPDPSVVDALLDRVRNDENVSVRLAAIEALAPLLGRPAVSRELLQALDDQDTPLVRLSLAEQLLAAGVPGSNEAVERLLERPDVEESMKEYLRELMRQSS